MEKEGLNTKEVLRVGIVGCGEIAKHHLSSLDKIKPAKAIAVCDINQDLAQQTAERFKINRYYTDPAKLLENEPVDVVHITTPPQAHLPLSIQAIKAGCHLLVEKPVALNLSETEKMIEVAQKNKVKLCVVHDVLFLPVIMKAKSIIDKGAIGDLIGIDISHNLASTNPLTLDREHWCHKLPGGIFGEIIPHAIYLLLAFLGKLEVTAVSSQKIGHYDWLEADELRVILESKNSLATINSSVNGPSNSMAIDFIGTKTSLHLNSVSNGVIIKDTTVRRNRLPRDLENLSITTQWLVGSVSNVVRGILGRHQNGHYNLIKRFIQSLKDNTELPVAVAEVRAMMRLYDAITSQIPTKS